MKRVCVFFLLYFVVVTSVMSSKNQLFILKRTDHEILEKYCETYREHYSDPAVDHLQFMNFADCQPFVNPANIKRLIYYVRNSHQLHDISTGSLIELFYLAEYWQAPKSFVIKIIQQCQNYPDDSRIKPHAGVLSMLQKELSQKKPQDT